MALGDASEGREPGIREGWHWEQAGGLSASEGREPSEEGLKATVEAAEKHRVRRVLSECTREGKG